MDEPDPELDVAYPVSWLAPQRPVEGGTVFILPVEDEPTD